MKKTINFIIMLAFLIAGVYESPKAANVKVRDLTVATAPGDSTLFLISWKSSGTWYSRILTFEKLNDILADSLQGNGIEVTSGTLGANVDGTTIEISSDNIRVKDSGITTAKILDGTLLTADHADSQITLAKMTTAAVNYIGAGGSVTNNPDDLTLESSGDNIQMKDGGTSFAKLSDTAKDTLFEKLMDRDEDTKVMVERTNDRDIIEFIRRDSIVVKIDTVIQVGNAPRLSYDPQFVAGRQYTDTNGAVNGHGFDDNSFFTRSGGLSYASFDAKAQIGTGTSNAYNHYAGFEVDATLSTSGTTTNCWPFLSAPTVENGTLTNMQHFKISDVDTSGGGTVTNQYGLYIPDIDNATNNWAVYSAGSSAISYFGGMVGIKYSAPISGPELVVVDEARFGTTDEGISLRGLSGEGRISGYDILSGGFNALGFYTSSTRGFYQNTNNDVTFTLTSTTAPGFKIYNASQDAHMGIETDMTNGDAILSLTNDAQEWRIYNSTNDDFLIKDETNTKIPFQITENTGIVTVDTLYATNGISVDNITDRCYWYNGLSLPQILKWNGGHGKGWVSLNHKSLGTAQAGEASRDLGKSVSLLAKSTQELFILLILLTFSNMFLFVLVLKKKKA